MGLLQARRGRLNGNEPVGTGAALTVTRRCYRWQHGPGCTMLGGSVVIGNSNKEGRDEISLMAASHGNEIAPARHALAATGTHYDLLAFFVSAANPFVHPQHAAQILHC